MNLSSKKQIKELLEKNSLSPLKKFGQNFLCDENIVTKIADATGVTPDDYMLEIGAGLGALTQKLAAKAKKVLAVEIDKGLNSLYEELFEGCENIGLIEGDILDVDINKLAQTYFSGAPFYVCGNLPYYITSKIIMHILDAAAPIKGMVFMMQREVAERLCAAPGSTDYGSITAAVHYFAEPKLLFMVSKNCFYPAPGVGSAIVKFYMHQPPDVPHHHYTKVLRAAFSMRRKTIYNNLKQLATPESIKAALEKCGIPENTRAEALAPEDFCRLAKAIFPA